VLVLPFPEGVQDQTIVVSQETAPPFDGLAFEARQLPVTSATGTRMKPLDELGSFFLGATAAGQSMTFTLPTVKPGEYELLAEFVLAPVYGIVRLLVDGQQIGQPFDAYAPDVEAEGERVSFGTVKLTAGEHKVTVELTGKRQEATQYFISVKRFLLRPTAAK